MNFFGNPPKPSRQKQKTEPFGFTAGELGTLERVTRSKPKADHGKADHQFERDTRYPEWHGWHAARRGLGSNLYRLGVRDMVIQRILRHANVSTTATYYIKTAVDDVRNAMSKLENNIPAQKSLTDTLGTPNLDSRAVPASVN
jgi:integrase